MSFPTKKHSLKSTFKERLTDKIKILKELQTQSRDIISYTEAQFILNNKKLKQNIIKMFLSEILKDNYERIDRKWYQQLSETKILDDIFAIKRKAIEQQWVTENLNKNKLQQNEVKVRVYTQNAQNNKDAKYKVRALKNEIGLVAAQIDMSKNEEDSKNLMKKYLTLKSEFNFLANRNRRMKRLNEEKMCINNHENQEQKIQSIEKRMESLSLQKQRDKYLRALCRNAKISKSSEKSEKDNQIGKNRIKKLEEIFIDFARKECKASMLFDELSSSKDTIGLQNFLRMVSQTNIDSHLTLEERVKIFKQNSSYSRKIEFTNFVNALKQICQKNCEKIHISFDSKILDIFLDQFVLKVEGSSRLQKYEKNLKDLKKETILKGQELSKYKYKLSCHSGKMPQNIKEELSARKKMKEAKRISKQGYSYTVDNSPSQYSRIKTEKGESAFKQKKSYVDFKSRQIKPFLNIQSEPNQGKQTIMSRYMMTNNYANIFQKRKILQNRKRGSYCLTETGQQRGKISERKISQQSQEIYPSKTISVKNSLEVQPVVHAELQHDKIIQQLIHYEDDDPFLTSHLQNQNQKNRWNRNTKVGNSYKVHF